jgi:TolB protein
MAALALIALGYGVERAEAQESKPNKILFVSNRAGDKQLNIYTMNPDGTEQTALTKGDGFDFDPVWSPDGKRIAFVSAPKVVSGAKPDTMIADLYVMNADGTGRTRIVQGQAGSGVLAPCWSPDGKRIAFSTAKLTSSSPSGMHLVVVDSDGKSRKELGAGIMPVWSPDGKQILFTNGEQTPAVYVMDADGGNTKKIADKGFLAKWSPDGKQVVYLNIGDSSQGGLPALTLVNADGTGAKPIPTGDVKFALGAEWTADKLHLIINGMQMPTGTAIPPLQVYTMNPDGSGVKALTMQGKINVAGSGVGVLVLSMIQQAK